MSEDNKETNTKWFENPIANVNTNDNDEQGGKTQIRRTIAKSLSRWFVSNQKSDTWDETRLNT